MPALLTFGLFNRHDFLVLISAQPNKLTSLFCSGIDNWIDSIPLVDKLESRSGFGLLSTAVVPVLGTELSMADTWLLLWLLLS